MAKFHTYDIFYDKKGHTIALVSYRGRPVKGYASCAPEDAYSASVGAEIAIARCDCKVAEKRATRAEELYAAAKQDYERAVASLRRARSYRDFAYEALNIAESELSATLEARNI